MKDFMETIKVSRFRPAEDTGRLPYLQAEEPVIYSGQCG